MIENPEDKLDVNNVQSLWLKLFCAKSKEDLDMLEETNVKEIKKAVAILRELTAEEETQDLIRRMREGELDVATIIDDAREEEKERRKAERERAIAFMRENNIPEDKIQSYLESVKDDD